MDRAKAKSMTRTVQTFAVGLLGLTAVAALVPLGAKAGPVETGSAQPPVAAPPLKLVEVAKVELDAPGAAAFLNVVAGPVKNGPKDPEPSTSPTEPPPVTGIDACRYLGGIISNTYKRAILVVNDQQQMLSEGQKFKPDPVRNPTGEVEVVEIDRIFVKVKDGEVEHTIYISPRQKPVLSLLDPAAAARVGSPGYSVTPNGRAPNTGSQAGPSGSGRYRDLERMKMDAKNRGDVKAAEMLDAEMNAAGKDGKFERPDKGQK